MQDMSSSLQPFAGPIELFPGETTGFKVPAGLSPARHLHPGG
jgi:hypothetical protein